MPNWKKVVVSGSDASLNSLYVLNSVTASIFSGSYTGSLFGTASFSENTISSSYLSGSAAIITDLTSSNDASINGLIIGRGGGNSLFNTAFGNIALSLNTTGTSNVAIGSGALTSNTTGINNTAIGRRALLNNDSGSTNVAIGRDALNTNRTGSFNTALGVTALAGNFDGNNNTAIGYRSGYGDGTFANSSGTNNIFIGYLSTGVSSTESNRTWIGNSSTTTTWLAGNLLLGSTSDNGYIAQINISGSASGSLFVSGSSVMSGSLTVTEGITGSLFGTASWAQNALTASYADNANLLDGKDSTVFATTGSNTFLGTQTITGSLNVSGSTTQTGNNTLTGNTVLSGSIRVSGSQNFLGDQTLTGSFLISGSTDQIGDNTLLGNTVLTGSITISSSFPVGSYSSSVNIYGDTTMTGYLKFNPQSTNIDSNISASYVFVSGSTNDLYFAQNNNGYSNVTRLRWIEGNLYTGLLHGGLISTQSSTVYQVSSGSGIIVQMNATIADDPYPTTTFIAWPNLSASIAPLSASFDQSFIAIEASGSSGVIYAQGLPYDNGQFNTLIPIGNVVHQNRSSINATATYPSVAYAYKQRSSDFIRAFGPLKISGLGTQVSGSSTGSLIITPGTSYNEGRNYVNDPNSPSYVTDSGQPVSKIFRYYQSGSGFVYQTNGGAGFQSIDPGRYNNDGTLSTVANNKWSLQRVFYFPGGATKGIYVYYGNAVYDSQLEAIANIPTETFIEAPNTAAGAILSAILVLQGNANFTNASTFSIRQAGLFRNVGGSGGGGSATTNRLVDLSDVNIISPTNYQALVYDDTTLKWENKSFISASISGNSDTSTTSITAATASSADNFIVRQNITASNALITGTITAQTLVVSTVSSSVVYSSGSNIFGNSTANTQTFTGSVNITGSLNLIGRATINDLTGSLFGTSSWAQNSISASRAVTASFAFTASSADNFLVRQTLTASAALISGSGTQRLTVVGSGSAQPLFTVLGSQGELFSITDSLSGSLFSVNDISGLPIMEVFSDSTTLMGNYSAPMLITTFRTGSVAVGANVIYRFPTASYDGIFIDYTIKSGSNARAGNFSAIWTATSVNFMDNSTVDFGNTSGFVFGAHVSGSNMIVTGSATTTGWTVKTIIRAI